MGCEKSSLTALPQFEDLLPQLRRCGTIKWSGQSIKDHPCKEKGFGLLIYARTTIQVFNARPATEGYYISLVTHGVVEGAKRPIPIYLMSAYCDSFNPKFDFTGATFGIVTYSNLSSNRPFEKAGEVPDGPGKKLVSAEKLLENEIVKWLVAREIPYLQQPREKNGIPDIIILVEPKIIVEVKADAGTKSVADAVHQLYRYQQDFPGAEMCFAAPGPIDILSRLMLSAVGIGIWANIARDRFGGVDPIA